MFSESPKPRKYCSEKLALDSLCSLNFISARWLILSDRLPSAGLSQVKVSGRHCYGQGSSAVL